MLNKRTRNSSESFYVPPQALSAVDGVIKLKTMQVVKAVFILNIKTFSKMREIHF